MRFVLKKFMSPIATFFGVFLLFFVVSAQGQTYTTIANGNWNNPAIWSGGVVPNTDEVNSGVTINVNHAVFYDRGTPIKNKGTFRVERIAGGPPASLTLPTNINVENLGGNFYIVNASFVQCRFVPCNNGQPYSGVNPGATTQSGSFKNIGGYVEVRGSYVEIAQDWTSESNGTRLMIDSCIFTGQNFSVSSGSDDTLTRVQVSIGWHNSGNFQVSASTIRFNAVQIQLAGTGGSVQFDSASRAGGDIDYITLRNQVGNFIGTGEIFADPDLKNLAGVDALGIIDLDAYCVSSPTKYKPNGKFTGTQLAVCDDRFACLSGGTTAGDGSIEGRVTSADGRGIRNVTVTVRDAETSEPVTVLTSPFGYYIVKDIEVGKVYFVSVASTKRHQFSDSTRVVSLVDSLTDMNFVADSPVPFVRQPKSRR